MTVPAETIDHVVKIMKTSPLKVVGCTFYFDRVRHCQDADRLDARSYRIARAFNYGGFKNRALHDPTIAPNTTMTKEGIKRTVRLR
jgi:uncharacterized protein